MILLIDNYDSFSYNLYQLVGSLRPDIQVVRNDQVSVEDIRRMNPSHLILSPGPGRPADAGVCEAAIRELSEELPILGVCLGHQAQPVPDGGEALVGVVLAVEQAVLGAGGHHAVGLVGALGHQVVDEHPDVALVPAEDQGGLPQKLQRGVHPGHKPLDGGLLIAGGAVELPRPVQPGDVLYL